MDNKISTDTKAELVRVLAQLSQLWRKIVIFKNFFPHSVSVSPKILPNPAW